MYYVMYREFWISRFGSYLRNCSRYLNSEKSTAFQALILTFWPHLHVSIFIDRRVTAISVIWGNDVMAAAILNILKSVNFWNDYIDIDYVQFKFQENPYIIHIVVIMADTVNFANDLKMAAILNI